MPLDGPSNFRDLGGYRTESGVTAWGKIYRSDVLSALTDADVRALTRLGLRTVVDLRHPTELARTPNHFAGHGQVQFHHEPLLLDAAWIPETAEQLGRLDIHELNREMVRSGGPAIALLFHLLANAANCPLAFHCRGGRDRTGLSAALILLSVGVSREDVMSDYLLSNQYLVDRLRRSSETLGDDDATAAALIEKLKLQEGYLSAALDVIDAEFGGVNGYLSGLGITDTELRALEGHFVQAQ